MCPRSISALLRNTHRDRLYRQRWRHFKRVQEKCSPPGACGLNIIAAELMRGAICFSISSPAPHLGSTLMDPVMFPPGRDRLPRSPSHRIDNDHEHDREDAGCRCTPPSLDGASSVSRRAPVPPALSRRLHRGGHPHGPTNPSVHSAIYPARSRKLLGHYCNPGSVFQVALRPSQQHSNPPHPLRLLRAGSEWPGDCHAAERRNELPPSNADCHLTL